VRYTGLTAVHGDNAAAALVERFTAEVAAAVESGAAIVKSIELGRVCQRASARGAADSAAPSDLPFCAARSIRRGVGQRRAASRLSQRQDSAHHHPVGRTTPRRCVNRLLTAAISLDHDVLAAAVNLPIAPSPPSAAARSSRQRPPPSTPS
jgi:hypothetical protein